MNCQPTNVPPAEAVDIPALREKYRQEREKRLNTEGEAQFIRVAGEFQDLYVSDPHKPVVPRLPIHEDLDVLVLGGGFGGLLSGAYLAKAGVTNIRNIDHAGDFGGVWYWNRYPGVQCDNDAYCYLPLLEETGFMPSRKFANGSEIYEYCRKLGDHYGLTEKALFHTLITSLRWDEDANLWSIETNRGDRFRARFVIMAAGVLNMPKLPGIHGIDKFKGKMFHTARWDYEYTGGTNENPVLDKLTDKTVAIIGTGATAIQAVPHLARYAKKLYVIQRTPSTIDERPNPPTDPDWAKSLPPGWQEERRANFHRAAMEFFQPGEPDLICDIWTEISRNLAAELEAEGWPELPPEEFMARRERVDYQVMERLRKRVEDLVEDPEDAEALKPWYRYQCKRPLSSDDFYPAFNRPNVELIDVSSTKGVERMTEHGFFANGQEYEVDCMVFASGFEVTSDLERRWGIGVVNGRDARSIYDHWRHGPKTLHGVMTHGFPNMFFIGYIQGGLNASVTEQFGRQGEHSAYIISEALKRGVKAVEPSKEAQDAYVRTFEELEIDQSGFQRECTPSYFTNEGQVKAPWALFRNWGPGWDHFQGMLREWRERGDLEGMLVTS
jgi:cation diffusion facilitator CzcD-associated flavoprotein CzcO